MEQILIEVDTPQGKERLLALLPKLNSRIVKRTIPRPKSDKSPVEILRRMAAQGGIGDSFGDASEWQREIRSWDRALDGREE